MVTLYNVISADGFIARENGDEDFIPDELWEDFMELCRENDAVVMGRKTYEAIQNYPEQLIKEFEALTVKKIIVTRDHNFAPKSGYEIAHSPQEALISEGNVLLSSGPALNTSVLRDNLIDQVIFNILPEKIGKGIKVFESEPPLAVVSTEERKGGWKRVVYKVEKQ